MFTLQSGVKLAAVKGTCCAYFVKYNGKVMKIYCMGILIHDRACHVRKFYKDEKKKL